MTATRTEDRLVAALQARADQVRPEDLTPFVTPEPARSRPRWGAYALAAAAVAAVVAAPFAVDALRQHVRAGAGAGRPVGEPGAEPGAEPVRRRLTDRGRRAEGQAPHRRGTADVDGDRQPDAVTMTYRTGRGIPYIDVHVTVTLAAGGTSTATSQAAWGPDAGAAARHQRRRAAARRAACGGRRLRRTAVLRVPAGPAAAPGHRVRLAPADQQRGPRRPGAPVVVRHRRTGVLRSIHASRWGSATSCRSRSTGGP